MSLVPLALPIGILLASVMLFGNLGEHYELSSMKSAGISLFRIMLPLIFLCGGISFFSYTCNEYLIPLSNLKFKSRLYDLRKSRPTLNLEEGVFNEDFNGYGYDLEDNQGECIACANTSGGMSVMNVTTNEQICPPYFMDVNKFLKGNIQVIQEACSCQ